MSDYDAAFAAASGNKSEDNPYDAIMAGIMKKPAAAEAPENAAPVVKAGVAANNTVNSLPRQLGLTARYALEGPANAAQIITEPIRYLTDRLTGSTGKTVPLGALASRAADWLGLPAPEDATERVVGDASKLVAGSGALGMAANAAKAIPGVAGKVAEFLGSNMPQQLSAAAGAGLAGGASREGGGSPLQQGALSMIGGIVGGMAPRAATGAANAARRLLSGSNGVDIDKQLGAVLGRANVDYSQLPLNVRSALRSDLENAIKAGKELDPQAVARLADFKLTGLTPTRGMVSQNPVQITREMNLAKTGANSGDKVLHGLPLMQNENNAKLIGILKDAGANGAEPIVAGESVIEAIKGKDAALQQGVKAAYDKAKAMAGGDIPLDRKPVIDSIYETLAKENKMAFLPENIGKMLNNISAGVTKVGGQEFETPFTAQTVDNLKTMIATAQRGETDGNARAALALARNALEKVPLTPIKTQFGGNQVVTDAGAQYLRGKDAEAGKYMEAVNAARQEAAKRFGWAESARPIEAALDGAQPDKFVQQFVINGSLADAKAVASNAPIEDVRAAIVNHLKDKALGGASNEVGKFSQSNFNSALKSIGDRKLALFFSPEEIAKLKATGRVASYAQVQPVGSAVNNSNSGALLLGKGYDALMGIANSTPLVGPWITQPLSSGLKNLNTTIRTGQALNAASGALSQVQRDAPMGSAYLLPAAAAAGALLSAP